MPTYEYLCRSCGERLEVVQSFSDDALTVCEACGGELRKVFSAAGLIFKGSGWHVKDYASNAKSATGSSSSGSGSGSGSGSDSGSGGGSGGGSDSASSTPKKDASSGSSTSSTTSSTKSSTSSTD